MKEFRQEIKGTLAGVVFYWILGSVSFYLAGLTSWLAGFGLGCACGAVHYILIALRLARVTEVSAEKAMMFMRVGFILRFVFVLLVLVFAAQASRVFFASCAVGILGLYAVQTARVLWAAVSSFGKR